MWNHQPSQEKDYLKSGSSVQGQRKFESLPGSQSIQTTSNTHTLADLHRLYVDDANRRREERESEYILRCLESATNNGDHRMVQCLAAYSKGTASFPRELNHSETKEVRNDLNDGSTELSSPLSSARHEYERALQDAKNASPGSKEFMTTRAEKKKAVLVAQFEAGL